MEHEPRTYEIGFLATEEGGAQAVLEALKRRGAEVLLEGPVERISLAYPVRHQTGAYFGYAHFRVAPDAVPTIQADVRGHAAILRALIVTPPLMRPKPRWEGVKTRPRPVVGDVPQQQPELPKSSLPLSNEALEKQIEEILK
jgi:ribosomal protein S6